MRALILFLLHVYRWLLSPWLGRNCRFHPSCSAYALAAFRQYPLRRAGVLTVQRLLKCHPWHPGGYDPLPEQTAAVPGESDPARRRPRRAA